MKIVISFQHKPWMVLILILGLAVRLYGVQHGYPYSYYPDEAHFVKRALSFGSFDFNPHWFHKPAFYMYLLFFEYGVFFIFGKVLGLWTSTSEFAVSYVINPGMFYLIGRLTTVAFSVGSIWIVYKIGERHFNRRVGLVASLLLSLSFGAVVASQDVKADTVTMFFTIVSMLFLLNYVDNQKLGSLLLSVVAAGMGTATKEYSIIMLVPIMLWIGFSFFQKGPNKVVLLRNIFFHGLLVVFVFVLVVFVCSPYSFLDPLGRKSSKMLEVFFRLFGTQEATLSTVSLSEKPGFFPSAYRYIGLLFSSGGMGLIIGLLSSFGLALSIARLSKKMLLFLSFPVLFTIVSIVASPDRADIRHQLPLYPFLSVFGAYFITTFTDYYKRYQQGVYIGLSVLLVFPLMQILAHGYQVSKPDTRNVAKAWIESNVPLGVKVLLDENGVQLLSDKISLERDIKKASLADSGGQFTAHYDTYLKYQLLATENALAYDIHYIRFPWWRTEFKEELQVELSSEYDKDMANPLRPVGVDSYEHYVEKGFQYVVVQSEKYQNFINEHSKNREKFPSFARFYTTLFEKGVLVKEFSSAGGDLYGPTVKIFKIDGM